MTRAPAPAGYECLADVLDAALMQAASGKGAERHAGGHPFATQPMQEITRMVGIGFPLGQAMKKSQEAGTMASRGQADAARRELLGAINYLAGAVLALNGHSAAQDAAQADEWGPAEAQAAPTPADTHQPTPGLYEAPTRLRRGYERTPA